MKKLSILAVVCALSLGAVACSKKKDAASPANTGGDATGTGDMGGAAYGGAAGDADGAPAPDGANPCGGEAANPCGG